MNWRIGIILIMSTAGILFGLNPLDYAGFGVGNHWERLVHNADSSHMETEDCIARMTVDGYDTWVSVTNWDGGSDTSVAQIRPDGLYGFFDILDSGELVDLLICPIPVEIGDEWTAFEFDTNYTDTLGIDYHTTIIFNGKCVGFDDVSVPAGDFNACVILNLHYDATIVVSYMGYPIGTYTGEGDTDNWFARRVGSVYMIESRTYGDSSEVDTTELIAYSLERINKDLPIQPAIKELCVSPNPFNSAVSIQAPFGSRIEVYTLDGRLLHSENLPDNSQKTVWNPSEDTPAGVLLVRASFENESSVKKVIYMK